jgi:hypothetical protein
MKYTLLVLLFVMVVCGCGKPPVNNSSVVSLDELNRALATMSMRLGRLPTNIDELMSFPTLHGRSLPTPPEGEQLTLDYKEKSVVFAVSSAKTK